MREFDVVILGGGSAAESAAPLIAAAGRTVAVVERHRVGGECAYVACMPSKSLLRSAEVRRLARRAPSYGAAALTPDLGPARDAIPAALRRRDRVAEQRDDREAARRMERQGISVVRGQGTVTAPGEVRVGEDVLACDWLMIATGSEPVRPPIEGLEQSPVWTSDQLLSAAELPRSLIVLGGSAVGAELAQACAGLGVRVTLIEAADRLLPSDEPFAGELLQASLRADGVTVHLGAEARRAEPHGDGLRLRLADGTYLDAQRLLLASGRRPRLSGLGLEVLGIDAGAEALEVDDRCQVPDVDRVLAAGDVTGAGSFTHTATYQGRVAASTVLGGGLRADLRALPRAVFTDPVIASVGLTESQAREAGLDLVVASVDLTRTARGSAEGIERGRIHLVGDRGAGLLAGATVAGPGADTLIGELALAIRARVPLRVLADVIHPFPALGEALEAPLRELAEASAGAG